MRWQCLWELALISSSMQPHTITDRRLHCQSEQVFTLSIVVLVFTNEHVVKSASKWIVAVVLLALCKGMNLRDCLGDRVVRHVSCHRMPHYFCEEEK